LALSLELSALDYYFNDFGFSKPCSLFSLETLGPKPKADSFNL
jgi:hypothetical protein